MSNDSISKDSKVRNLRTTQRYVFFNTRMVFFCMPLRYTSEHVKRDVDGIKMNVFREDIKVKFCADHFTTDSLLSVPFKDAANSY